MSKTVVVAWWASRETVMHATNATRILFPEATLLKGELNKSHGFDARNVEPFAAAHIFTHGFVVQQYHVAGEFCEARPVAFVGAARHLVEFFTQHPAQVVSIG